MRVDTEQIKNILVSEFSHNFSEPTTVSITTAESNDTEELNATTVTPGEQPPTPPEFTDPNKDRDPSDNSWNNVNHISECQPAFDDLVDNYHYLESPLRWMKTGNQLSMRKYRENIKILFENSTVNVSAMESHRKCMEIQDVALQKGDIMIEIVELVVNVTKSESLAEAYAYAVQIPPLYKMTLTYEGDDLQEVETNVRETCAWLRELGEDLHGDSGEVEREFGDAKDQRDLAFRQFQSLSDLYSKLYRDVTVKIKPTVDRAMDYLQGSVKKSDLSQEFQTPFFAKAIEDVSDINKQLVEVIKDYTEEMTIGKNKLEKAYKELFWLDLPVMNSYKIHQLQLVQRAAEINNSVIEDALMNMDSDTLQDNGCPGNGDVPESEGTH